MGNFFAIVGRKILIKEAQQEMEKRARRISATLPSLPTLSATSSIYSLSSFAHCYV